VRSPKANPKSSSQWCIGINVAILMESSRAGGQATAEERLRPTGFLAGSVRGSGVWGGARKLEGELDVEQGRIVRLVGESIVVTAEPAGFWTNARVEVRNTKFGCQATPHLGGGLGATHSQGSGGFIAL